MKEYSRNEERTGVQESAAFDPVFDVQSDFVMVYGFHDLKNRIDCSEDSETTYFTYPSDGEKVAVKVSF